MNIKVPIVVTGICIPLLCLGSSVDFSYTHSVYEKTYILSKNKWITAILAFIGGIIGLQRWYLGHYKAGLFYMLCFLFTIAAIQFVARGGVVFPVLFILLVLGYLLLELIGHLKQIKLYLKPFQDMLLGLAFIPLAISILWISLIITFSGRSVYLVLFTSIFTLFSLFMAIRYLVSGRREFIERFYKNRSIWH